MTQRNTLAAHRRSIFIFFAVVAFFATSAFAQDTAHIPFKFNVDVIVTATQGERVITQEFKANTLDTLRLHLGTTPLLSQGTVSKPVTMHNSRGKLSLELSPQFYRNAEISIYTLSGKRVLHDRVEAAKNISHLNLATGVYLLHIRGGSSTFSTRVAHQGGGMNIEVGFGSVSSLSKEHLGVWTITVTAKDKETHLDLTYTITAETGVHATHTINSNGSSFVRQQQNTGGGTPVVIPPVTPPAPTALMECDANKLAVTKSAEEFTQENIICWVGEKSGTNKAMLIFNWNDGKGALAWGYRWSGTKHGINILADVAKADGRLFFLEKSGTQFGSAIAGIGYNESGSANAKVSMDGGISCESPVNGSIGTSDYLDFDKWKLCLASSNARFQAGWYENYWSYWVVDAAGEWGYSGLGASSRELKNNSIDAWYFSPLSGNDIETDCKGKDCFNKIAPAGAPASSPVVTPSSSSVVVTPSSSSSVELENCDGKKFNPATHFCREDKVIVHNDCEDFIDGTVRTHEGKDKEQFCDIRDGKKYVQVNIGEQTWMAQNLNYSGEDGNLGSVVSENYGRKYSMNQFYCSSGCNELQWGVSNPLDHSVEIGCPVGWHLPTTTEVEALWTHSDPNFVPGSEMTGQGVNSAATKLKVTGWGGTDAYGFSALSDGSSPGPFWLSRGYGAPVPLVKTWQMTSGATVNDAYQSYGTTAVYVRCLKDKTPNTPTPEAKLDPIRHDDYNYFTDSRDGKEYPYVNIGKKNWMAKNLNYETKAGNSACYNNFAENCDNYGRLYNWAAATSTTDSVCPRGWNLPTDADWTDLTTAVGSGAAGKLKAKIGWEIKSTNGTTGTKGTDDYGFAALPGGYGNLSTGNFATGNTIVNFGSARGGFWWSATQYAANGAYIRHIGPTSTNVTRVDNDRSRMYSVRCVSEGDFCGGKPYDKNKDFCLDKEIIPLCSGKNYNPATEFCQDSTEKILPLCNGKPHKYEQVCLNNELVYRDCSDFENGTTREHQGEMKAQFCDKRDGQKYVYVNMGGDDIWMAENLNYEAEQSRCYNDATGGDSQKNCEKYGRLYLWPTAKTSCPAGWHLPTRAEWNALGKEQNELKTKSGWDNNNNGKNVPPGFSALPGGRMTYNVGFAFSNVGSNGYWWSADEGNKVNNNTYAYSFQINNGLAVTEASVLAEGPQGYNKEGFSVRCVRDEKCKGDECEAYVDDDLESCGKERYDDKTHFCFNNEVVVKYCGGEGKERRTEKYNPDDYECRSNAIYLKQKLKDEKSNEYEAVLMGRQTWMAENLRYDDKDGASKCIPSETKDAKGSCKYGNIYKFSTATGAETANGTSSTTNPSGVQGVCPSGWHVPSLAEWGELSKYISDLGESPNELKADWNEGWTSTNKYGFSVLPIASDITTFASWWTTDKPTNPAQSYRSSLTEVFTSSNQSVNSFFPVRCLKNN